MVYYIKVPVWRVSQTIKTAQTNPRSGSIDSQVLTELARVTGQCAPYQVQQNQYSGLCPSFQ